MGKHDAYLVGCQRRLIIPGFYYAHGNFLLIVFIRDNARCRVRACGARLY